LPNPVIILALLLAPAVAHAQSPAQAPALPGVKVVRDVAYVDGGSAAQKLDLYLPEKAGGPWPLIIWVHGGGWKAGDKAGCPARRMTGQGYAVASINYRLSDEARFPAQIEDCKAAIRWLRSQATAYNLDPAHFGVWGSSAGGHLVALLGTSGTVKDFDRGGHLDMSSRVQAVCDYYGPTDLLQMDAHALAGATLKHDQPNSPEAALIGGPIQENKDKAERANPIRYITPDAPPFLIVHGDQDPVVAHYESELLYEALKKAGLSVHFHTMNGAGHGIGIGGAELDRMVDDFFARYLKSDAKPDGKAVATQGAAALAPGRPGGTPPTAGNGGPAARPPITWERVSRDDANGDGKVTREEFKGPPKLFDLLDRNHDGVLTKEEFTDPPWTPSGTKPGNGSPGN
jgi:acetyl esterase/lipase